jgi:hypothetical protein
MSVANLSVPNDFILYSGDFYSNAFDSINFGGSVAFGAAKSQETTLGNVGGPTVINGNPVIINGEPYPPFGPGATGNNVFYGPNTGNTGVTGSGNIGFGIFCLHNVSGGDDNVAMGDVCLPSLTYGNNNVAIGDGSLFNLTTGSENIAIGTNSMVIGVTGSQNVALGYGTLYFNQGNNNIALGTNAGASLQSFESNNICISSLGVSGDQSVTRIGSTQTNTYCTGIYGVTGDVNPHKGVLVSKTGHLVTETPNVFMGGGSGSGVTGITGNVGIGLNALSSITTGASNVAIGNGALQKSTSGASSVAIGLQALQNCVDPTGTNVGIGYQAGQGLLTGSSNVCIGPQAFLTATTGTANTAIGYSALSSGSGSNNIAVGASAGSAYAGHTGSNIYIGNIGNVNDVGAMYIGTVGTHTSNWQAGIYGVTTGTTGLAVLVDAGGQLGTISSSRILKENIEPLKDVKDIIAGLEPVSFNYKVGGGKTVGLIADDAKKFIPELIVGLGQQSDEGVELETIQYHLLPIYLLQEIKRLQKQVDYLSSKVDI